MNCRTCQFELSQCLDGRLPSGRRTLVMQHIAACDACATFWNELQKAQELALQLPRLRVSADFRTRLWERIESGEGTPDAVFHQPVPLATKVRYLVTGAAAAAAVLFATTLMRGKTPAEPAPTTHEVAQSTPPAPIEPTPAALAGSRLTPRMATQRDAMDPGFSILSAARPLTPDLVCVEAARQFERTYDFTTRRVDRLPQEPDRQGALEAIAENAKTLHDLGSLLIDLREDDRFSFHDASIDADLRYLVRVLETTPTEAGNQDRFLRVVAPSIREAKSLARLSEAIRVAPTRLRSDEATFLLQLSQRRPQVFSQLFFLAGTDVCALEEVDPTRMFLFRDHCGVQQFGLPRSEVEDGQMRLRVLRLEGAGGEIHIQVDATSRK